MPGKPRKILPPVNKDISLSQYGYKVHSKKATRQQSLRKASKKHGSLKVLRRLNLIRNYTHDKDNKKIMTQDVEFMKRENRLSKRTSRKKSTSRKK